MQESRLYLIFEFLSMDLKKYLDSIPPGQYMDPMLVKVSVCCFWLLVVTALDRTSLSMLWSWC